MINQFKSWSFLFCLLLSGSLYAIQDTIVPPNKAFGISLRYNSLNTQLELEKGYGLQFSVFYEKQRMERIRSLIGLRIDYNNYERNLTSRRTRRDTTYASEFILAKELITISLPVTVHFDYFLSPKAYVLLGFVPEFSLSEKADYRYLITNIRTTDNGFLEEITDPDYVEPEDSDKVFFDMGFEFGMGVEIKQTAVELLVGFFVFGGRPLAAGVRVRQKLGRK